MPCSESQPGGRECSERQLRRLAKLVEAADKLQQRGGEAAPAPEARQRRRERAAETRGELAEDSLGAAVAEALGLPRKDGPRRAKRIRAFLEEQSFGEAPDLLRDELPAPPRAKEAAPPQQAAPPQEAASQAQDSPCRELPLVVLEAEPAQLATPQASEPSAEEVDMAPQSPTCVRYLQSLHTGLTPEPERRRPRPVARPLLAFGRRRRGRGEEAAAEGELALNLDSGDGRWQPKGVESFICEARAWRLRSTIPRWRFGSPRRTCAAELQASADVQRAPELMRDMQRREKRCDSPSARSLPSESEDESAPIADIPATLGPCGWPSLTAIGVAC